MIGDPWQNFLYLLPDYLRGGVHSISRTILKKTHRAKLQRSCLPRYNLPVCGDIGTTSLPPKSFLNNFALLLSVQTPMLLCAAGTLEWKWQGDDVPRIFGSISAVQNAEKWVCIQLTQYKTWNVERFAVWPYSEEHTTRGGSQSGYRSCFDSKCHEFSNDAWGLVEFSLELNELKQVYQSGK